MRKTPSNSAEAVSFTTDLTQTFANPLSLSNKHLVASHSSKNFIYQTVEPNSPRSSKSSNSDSPNSKLILSRRLSHIQYLDIAREHCKAARYHEAIKACDTSIAREMQNPDAYHQRGLIYKTIGEYGKAKADLLKAEAQGFTWLKKPIGALYREMALIYIEVREYKYAVNCLLQADLRGVKSAKRDLANLHITVAEEEIEDQQYLEAKVSLAKAKFYQIPELKQVIADLQKVLDSPTKLKPEGIGVSLSQAPAAVSYDSVISPSPLLPSTYREVLLNAKPKTQSSLASVPVSGNKPEMTGSRILPKVIVVQPEQIMLTK